MCFRPECSIFGKSVYTICKCCFAFHSCSPENVGEADENRHPNLESNNEESGEKEKVKEEAAVLNVVVKEEFIAMEESG